ncbi:hypothetical protein PV328_010056 [Microctonus aethiopoides]|uniref:AAA-ATPase-like domain-containing protein n=1 Tax=Microctonus aethiopoides TaxID=144406 RepID=A0AA39EYB8_9HYME|nr:hypothetical protein PV328_010056 [Microctonus aethiopoides]
MTPTNIAQAPVFHMNPDFNLESSDLKQLVSLITFIDKSSMIPHLFKNRMVLITAPHHFGKSTNMDMIKKFVEIQVDNDGKQIDNKTSINRAIFEKNNLHIFREHREFFDKHFATFPVIHVDFKLVIGDSFEQILEKLQTTLHTTFKNHKYLLTNDKLENDKKEQFKRYYDAESYTSLTEYDIITGLTFLSECVFQYFDKEVFVLIDNYDTPINQTILNKNIDLERLNKLMSKIFEDLLVANEFVARAFLTGTSYFASVELSEIDNIKKFMFLGNHEFVPYYGLTLKDLRDLSIRFQIDSDTEREIILFYRGYESKKGEVIFSIWSILNFLHYYQLNDYWEAPEATRCLENALCIPAIRNISKVLCYRWNIEIEILDEIELQHLITLRDICSKDNSKQITRPDIIFHYLFHQGYLSIERRLEGKGSKIYKVKVPRREITHIIKKALMSQFNDNVYELEKRCAEYFNQISVDVGDLLFINLLNDLNNLLKEIKESGKLFDYGENFYNCLMFCFLTEAKGRFAREFTFQVVKSGCPDLIILKRRTVIIIKLTFNETADEALKKIKNRCYDKVFHIHRTIQTKIRVKYICIGINISEDNIFSMSICKKTEEGFYARRTFPNDYAYYMN